jgi:hypothetical protein
MGAQMVRWRVSSTASTDVAKLHIQYVIFSSLLLLFFA